MQIDFNAKIHEYDNCYFLPRGWWRLRKLTDRWNWIRWNGYPQTIKCKWNNLLVWLTPWFRPWRHLLHTFSNKNSMKLLDDNRNFAYLRTHCENQYYYTLRKRWLFWAELEEKRFVDTKDDGRPINAFLAGMVSWSKKMSPYEVKEQYKEQKRILCRGFVLTKKGCQKMLDKIVGVTKDKIDWFEETEEVK